MPTDQPNDPVVELGQLSTVDYRRLVEFVAPFERACLAARDQPTLIDLSSFLPSRSEPLFRTVLLEIIKIDLEYRWQQLHPVRLDEYLHRFPELGSLEDLPADLILEEYLVRSRLGDRPELAEYRDRFPRQFVEFERLLTAEPAATMAPPGTTDSGTRLARVLSSRYELQQELGRGGMGVVYKAYDHKRRRLVALKTMHGLDPSALLRFNNEFRALVDLTHPNLVNLFELATDGDRRYFTMELVIGCDLLAYVREPDEPAPTRETPQSEVTLEEELPPAQSAMKPLTADQLVRLRHATRQLAEGVLYLHDAGRLHRDLKPGNVLVTAEGHVKLLDFGLAAELDRTGLYQSTDPHVLGTVAYMAPEQAASLPLSTATDWYAVGTMLFEAFTGRLPFDGRPLEILMDKQTRASPSPCDLVPNVPEDLNALIVDLLQRDPTIRPSGRDILARLKPGEPPPPRRHVTAPFVGRERHLDALREAFQEVQQRRAVTVYVHGRSGVGKTALVQRFLDELVKRGEAVVLRGRCYEQESVPFKALDSVIDALTRYLRRQSAHDARAWLPRDVSALARVFPSLEMVPAVRTAPRRDLNFTDPHELRRRAVTALRELLARIGDDKPIVIAIDDLQWGDADSASLLRDLTQPPDAPVLMLLCCYRSDEAATSPCLRLLLKSQDKDQSAATREVVVGALTAEECKELALAMLSQSGPASDHRAESIARDSGGNPFFVCELAQHIQSSHTQGDARNGLEGDTALNEVLWARVLRLDEPLRKLLEVVAVAGRPVRIDDACRAAGSDEARDALTSLRSGRLVRSTGPMEAGLIETYHDRIRETVIAHLTADTRRQHHHRLAEVLETSGSTDFEALTVHFRDAGVKSKAAHFAVLAADKAAQALAFSRAAQLYRLALDLATEPKIEATARLRVRLAEVLAHAGRGTEAAHEYLAAAPALEAVEQRELQRRAALHLMRNGQIDHGLSVLEKVASSVGLRIPETQWRCLAELVSLKIRLWWRGLKFEERNVAELPGEKLAQIDVCFAVALGLIMVEPFRGASFGARGLLLALDAGEPSRLALALIAEALYCAVGGTINARARARLLDMARSLAERLGKPELNAVLLVARVGVAAAEGSWTEARRLGDEAEALIRDSCPGLGAELAVVQHFTLRA